MIDADYPSVRALEGVDQRWVPGNGQVPTAIAIVGEGPGSHEVRRKSPLVGPTGEINWQFSLRYGGITRHGGFIYDAQGRVIRQIDPLYVTNWSKLPLTDDHKKK